MSRIARSCAAAFLLLPIAAPAHHASSEYDDSRLEEVTGEVVSVFWRNPHVRVVVRSASDEEWEVEGSSVNRLERLGVEPEMFGAGERITLLGFSSRRGERRLLPVYATLASGRQIVMTLEPAKRFELVEESARANVTLSDAEADIAAGRASGIFRVWTFSGRSGGVASLPLTASARARRDAWVQPRDQAWTCEPPGLIENMLNPYPIEFVDRGTEIVVRMEQWDSTRTIHLGVAAEEGERSASRMGYSVGRWEERSLIVETTHLDNPNFDDRGTPHGADFRVVERFTLSDDETRLEWEATVDDPETFTEPVTPETMHWIWIPGEEVRPFDCSMPSQP